MMRKLGLLMLSWTLWKRFWTCCCVERCPQMRYLLCPLTEICTRKRQRQRVHQRRERESALEPTHLARNRDLGHVLEPDRCPALVRVVEHDRDGRAGDAGLAALVDQVEEVGGADLQARRASAKAPRLELVWRKEERTVVRLVMPRTKQIESRMLDLPEPFLRGG